MARESEEVEESESEGAGSPTRTAANPVGKRLKRALCSAVCAPRRGGTTYRVVALNSIRLLPPVLQTSGPTILHPSLPWLCSPLPWLRCHRRRRRRRRRVLGELLRKCFLCVSV